MAVDYLMISVTKDIHDYVAIQPDRELILTTVASGKAYVRENHLQDTVVLIDNNLSYGENGYEIIEETFKVPNHPQRVVILSDTPDNKIMKMLRANDYVKKVYTIDALDVWERGYGVPPAPRKFTTPPLELKAAAAYSIMDS